jgi:hypothetical protein
MIPIIILWETGMTTGESLYLVTVIGAFLAFSGVLAWASITSSGKPETR